MNAKAQREIEALRSAGILVGEADFHTLSGSQVEHVIAAADRYGYRKPANANGSRGRYFYALLERERAKR